MNRIFSAFGAGLLFGLGLLVSGMTRPSKVIGFLDVAGSWDPSLMFVMVGGIAVHLVLYRLISKRPAPVLDDTFHLPKRAVIDGKLFAGAAIFGVGWGLGGFCPGPGITSVGQGGSALAFAVAMAIGMGLHKLLAARFFAR